MDILSRSGDRAATPGHCLLCCDGAQGGLERQSRSHSFTNRLGLGRHSGEARPGEPWAPASALVPGVRLHR